MINQKHTSHGMKSLLISLICHTTNLQSRNLLLPTDKEVDHNDKEKLQSQRDLEVDLKVPKTLTNE